MINFTETELNYLLFNTNSMFHNKGLCIYSLSKDLMNSHKMDFYRSDFESVKLPSFENVVRSMPELTQEKLFWLINDAVKTAEGICESVGRIGVLLSHTSLIDEMRPHIHRQAYSTEILPCITVQYRISFNSDDVPQFIIWDMISQEQAIELDLCDRKPILDWCESHPFAETYKLHGSKNTIIFNSGLVPHKITHTPDLNMYFIFDHAKGVEYEMDNKLRIINHEGFVV